jgi:hypothetical protein
MAGDWIKWTVGLCRKPEVARIAADLSMSRDSVVCRLMELWEWCDATIPDSSIRPDGTAFVKMSPDAGDNMSFVDDLLRSPGFANSLAAVDWIRFRNGHIEIPNFGRHNGETAKTRARNAKNQGKKRAKTETRVTEMSPDRGDKKVTREREEKSITLPFQGVSPDVVIPEKLKAPEVQEAASLWWAHLRLEHPDKVPEPNSPQLQAFWNDASRMGPKAFVDAVNWSAKNRWATLRERPSQEHSKPNSKAAKVLQDF